MQKRKQEDWLDIVKIFACILVALGHLFQSLISSGIMMDGSLHRWFDQSIYAFHVPLFFICSGYLYQKKSRVDSLISWKRNVLKKLLVLGVPYFTFSLATWILKAVFSNEVNSQVEGLLETLLLRPINQFWYLYCLFLLFVITPTFCNKKACICGFMLALTAKGISCFWDSEIRALSFIFQNEIWFVIGMCICCLDIMKLIQTYRGFVFGIAAAVLFIAYSFIRNEVWGCVESFVLGLIACFACVAIFSYSIQQSSSFRRITNILKKYTLPVYLMHTIFAAGFRAVLLKMQVDGAAVHTIVGIFVSFAGPVIACELMQRIKYLDFFLYPGKYLRL